MKELIDSAEEKIDPKLINYGREMIMLSFLYEKKLLTKNEMLTLSREIMEDYGVKGNFDNS